jgi:hypothetical protein
MAAASSMASMVPSHHSVLNLNLTAQRLTAYRSKGCPERCCSSMAVSVRNRVIGKAGSLASMLGRLSSSISSPYTTYVAAGALGPLAIQNTPNVTLAENDLFSVTTAIDGSTWAVGWALDIAAGVHAPLILHGVQDVWSLVASPSFLNLDSGLASIAAVPGGGLWAVGLTSAGKNSNFSTLIKFHP